MKGDLKRHAMPAQPPEERIKNFREVALGYTPELALAEAERCLNCKNAPCMKGCPVGVHIPDFIAHIRAGELDKSAERLLADNNLPAVCDIMHSLCTKTQSQAAGLRFIGADDCIEHFYPFKPFPFCFFLLFCNLLLQHRTQCRRTCLQSCTVSIVERPHPIQ